MVVPSFSKKTKNQKKPHLSWWIFRFFPNIPCTWFIWGGGGISSLNFGVTLTQGVGATGWGSGRKESQTVILGEGKDEKEGRSSEVREEGEGRREWRAPFLEAMGWSRGWAGLWAASPGTGQVGGVGERAVEGISRSYPSQGLLRIAVLHLSLPFFPHAFPYPQPGKIQSELIKAADCLEMKNEG